MLSPLALELSHEWPPGRIPVHARGELTGAKGLGRCIILPVKHKTEDGMDAESRAPVRLPVGYRLVAVASDAWVLLAPGGIRVARYLGSLDRWRVELDAREHQCREV
jgi:hypothetical protein